MEIIVCVIFVLLVLAVYCNQRNVQFAKDTAVSGLTCSAKELIGDIIRTETIQMCMSVCASTDGCKSVFYTHSECVRCRSRYRKADDARLLPMAGSVSYKTVVRCNPGWLSIQDSCYLWNSSTLMSFDQTKDYCSSLGAHVLFIDGKEENDVAANILPETATVVWIGIELKDGGWISYMDGKLVTYYNWGPGHPYDPTNNKCAALYKPYQWTLVDTRCYHQIHAVCELDM